MVEMKLDKGKLFRKRLRIIIGILFVCCVFFMVWVGYDIVALYNKPVQYEDVKESILQKEVVNNDLNHTYVELNIDKITGSYAAYGEGESSNQVYYLMPIENGTYFLTIIANRDYIPTFDEMEIEFYENFGEEDKTYKDPITVAGGFKKIAHEEQVLALDYFKLYDSNIQEIDQLTQYLSPYAFVIDEIGSIAISTLWTLFYVWIGILLLLMLCIILYIGSFCRRRLHKKTKKLPEEKQEKLNEDYEQAQERSYGKLGSETLYIEKNHQTTLHSYENMIWIYKKEKIVKDIKHYIIYAHMKDGKEEILLDSDVMKSAKTLVNDLQKQCPNALHGYQDFLYEVWKKNPTEFYNKLQSMNLLDVKQEKTVKKKTVKKQENEKKELKETKKTSKKNIVNQEEQVEKKTDEKPKRKKAVTKTKKTETKEEKPRKAKKEIDTEHKKEIKKTTKNKKEAQSKE